MPPKPSQKEATRATILRAAAGLFRRDGYHATGVDAVMAAAGLTAGGFYAHFRSKADLLANVLASGKDLPMWRGLETSGLAGADWLRAMIDGYLSATHRDGPAEGCLLPALAAEVGRGDPATRAAFEANVRGIAGRVGRELRAAGAAAAPAAAPAVDVSDEPSEAADAPDAALVWVAIGVGAQVLARGVGDEALSNRILAAARDHLESAFVAPAVVAVPSRTRGARPRTSKGRSRKRG